MPSNFTPQIFVPPSISPSTFMPHGDSVCRTAIPYAVRRFRMPPRLRPLYAAPRFRMLLG